MKKNIKFLLLFLLLLFLMVFSYYFFKSLQTQSDKEINKEVEEKNYPPKIKSLSSAFGCGIHNVAFFWRFSDINKDDIQSAFQIQIDDDEDFSSSLFDSQKSDSFTKIEADYFRYDLPEELTEAEQYFWRLKIWDNQGNASNWSRRQILPI